METARNLFQKPLVVVFSLVFFVFAFQWISSPMIITVTGTGEVSAPAESATITFTVTGESETTAGAISIAKSKVTKIKENLSASGIAQSDIYESQIATYPSSSLVEGASGFTAVSTMGLKTTQIASIDSIVSSIYAQGATLVSQPVLSIDDTQKLENEAFKLAIKDAKKRANAIALSNLKLLKKIVLVEQTVTTPTSTVTTKADVETQVEQNISPELGVIKIQKTLSVSYKMW